jgi:hypothetical protein
MSSLKQIEANRLNALKSTGPRTAEGKRRSRCNAVRHGLTAETLIAELEDPKDYEAFEATVISDYDASSAVERELVLRLASVLWRLRRATGIETALFEAMTERPCNFSSKIFNWTYDFAESDQLSKDSAQEANEAMRNDPRSVRKQHVAESFLRLSDLPTCPMDRLSRYEQRLWHQARQIVLTLKTSRHQRREPRRAGLSFSLRPSGPFFVR